MATLREWFKAFEHRHGKIVTVKLGRMDAWYGWETDEEYERVTGWPSPPPYLCSIENVPDGILDKEFGTDYGRVRCPPVFAWSRQWCSSSTPTTVPRRGGRSPGRPRTASRS